MDSNSDMDGSGAESEEDFDVLCEDIVDEPTMPSEKDYPKEEGSIPYIDPVNLPGKYKGVPKIEKLIDNSVYEQFGIQPFNPDIANYTLLDLDIEKMAHKPWENPKVDITDYFNYGFNENTWKEYLATQIHIRSERTRSKKISDGHNINTNNRRRY
eukprot:GAHX01000040.1.p1 GENE.GAHX01000040.1~~GAHX01000040.1.p1  ORF type:complete len:156 (+),score=47.55 GAHX01000040.1:37-504(+)